MKTWIRLSAAVLMLVWMLAVLPAALAAGGAEIDVQGTEYGGTVLAAVNTDLSSASTVGYSVPDPGRSELQLYAADMLETPEGTLFRTEKSLPVAEPSDAPGLPEVPREDYGYQVNDQKIVRCDANGGVVNVPMVCLYVSDHCTVWGQQNGTQQQRISAAEAQEIAEMFEAMLPDMAQAFGDGENLSENWADTDYDERVALLVYDVDQDAQNLQGTYTAGYFFVRDSINSAGYAGSVYYGTSNYNGNAMDCLHLDTYPSMYVRKENGHNYLDSERDTQRIRNVMAHEFQHMMNSYSYRNVSTRYSSSLIMETYFNEAMSLAAECLISGTDHADVRISYFNENYTVGTSLFRWSGTLSNYSLSCLFGQYVRCRYGLATNTEGWNLYSEVLARRDAQNTSTITVISDLLNTTPQQLLQDFWWSLYLNDTTGIYGFNSAPNGTPGHETWSDTLAPKMTQNPTGTTIYAGGGLFYPINDGEPGTVTLDSHPVLRYAGLTRAPADDTADTRSITVKMGDSKNNGWGSAALYITWTDANGDSITELFAPLSGSGVTTAKIPAAQVGELVRLQWSGGTSGTNTQCSFTLSYTDDPTGELLYASWESGLPEDYCFLVEEPPETYTVSAVSSDNTMGTVTVSGYRIEATPAPGFRIAQYGAYDVTRGEASVTRSGSAFLVAPESDCTVTVCFEPKTPGGDGETTYRALLIAAVGCGLDPDVWQDVSDVSAALQQAENYDVQQIVPLALWGAQANAADALRAEISRFFASNDADDVGLLYYAGHGETDGTTSYLAMNGSRISAAELKTLLDTQDGTFQLILDACYSGGFIAKNDAASAETDPSQLLAQLFEQPFAAAERARGLYSGDKYRILTTAAQNQLSWSVMGYGAGTTAMLSGIGRLRTDESYCSYPADADCDGSVTLQELFSWMEQASFYSTVRCYPQFCTDPVVNYDTDRYPGALFSARIVEVRISGQSAQVTIETAYSGTGTLTARYPLSSLDYELLAMNLTAPNAGGTIAVLTPGITTLTIPRTMLGYGRTFIRVTASDPGAAAVCLRLDVFAGETTPASYGVTLTLPGGETSSAADGEEQHRPVAWAPESGEEMKLSVRFDADQTIASANAAYVESTASGCRLTVIVQDGQGNPVRTLSDYRAANYHLEIQSGSYVRVGCSDFYWDGQDDRGKPLPTGCYAVTVRAEYQLESGVQICESTIWFYLGSPEAQMMALRETASGVVLDYYLTENVSPACMILAQYGSDGRLINLRMETLASGGTCGALALSGTKHTSLRAYLLDSQTLALLQTETLS